MGSIVGRKLKDGSVDYQTPIIIKAKGRIVHQESSNFDCRPTVIAWLARRAKKLKAPDALDAARRRSGTVGDVISHYLKAKENDIGWTKIRFSERSEISSSSVKFRVRICGLSMLPWIAPTSVGAIHLTCDIHNAGPAISDPHRARIFERNFRGANSAGKPGTGVGLFIARTLARMQGGDVALLAAGDVTAFRLSLPRPEGAAP